MRCVFDTNVAVSAMLVAGSVPARAIDRALNVETLLTSTELTRQLAEVCYRARFDQYQSRSRRRNFLRRLIRTSETVTITERIRACRDPKDDLILEVACNGQADCIITGDRDLLAMNPFRGVPIITPADFLAVAPGAAP